MQVDNLTALKAEDEAFDELQAMAFMLGIDAWAGPNTALKKGYHLWINLPKWVYGKHHKIEPDLCLFGISIEDFLPKARKRLIGVARLVSRGPSS